MQKSGLDGATITAMENEEIVRGAFYDAARGLQLAMQQEKSSQYTKAAQIRLIYFKLINIQNI
jgi:hypothetical protein